MPIERLPPRLIPFARRLRAWAMTDSFAILILGIGIIFRGVSYLPGVLGSPPPPGSHPAESSLPMPVWGVIWLVVGVICIISSITRSTIVDVIALCSGVMLNAGWGMSFVFASLEGVSHRSWVSSVGYFSVVILVVWAVWRGKRGDIPKEDRE
ncbi:hypothetical protein PBI_COLLEEN_26 [Corynebacterium phage Colleen]|uniref:Uncharacterized protein n=5 Tax=root TaxID=1 RepID=W5XX68_9CORY|nr:minor tail protein [Corynebacterium phage Poushou]AHI21616.1 hypothetical protein B843_01100 [Corynebacterium vitaeruminis DSM 20294]AWY06474.1 hypothetical protein PBI_TOUCHMENOT_26 [Corynebacterium phage TouchMeNot]QFG14775.1 hypothetical protein PBI_COLLEEN_26 [Corynebacterium phage Colleen]UVT31912.1 membrane protein [Corynebacterium phage Arianna]ASJ78985.1 hypothetical protein PBI_POUSHOU_26 [Corynebacterium phage Poushou]